MEFRVSQKIIRNKKRRVFYQFLIISIIMAFMTVSHFSRRDDVAPILFTFGVTFVIFAFFIIRNVVPDLKKLSLLSLEVNPKGVCIDDGNAKHLLSYERIQNIEVKQKREKIQKLIVKTNLKEVYDYSEFEKLDEINSLLKKYLNEELWSKN